MKKSWEKVKNIGSYTSTIFRGIANDDHLRLFSDLSFLIDSDRYNFWSSNKQTPSGSAIGFNQRRGRKANMLFFVDK